MLSKLIKSLTNFISWAGRVAAPKEWTRDEGTKVTIGDLSQALPVFSTVCSSQAFNVLNTVHSSQAVHNVHSSDAIYSKVRGILFVPEYS